MIYLSHAANVLILIPVCLSLWRDAPGMTEAFGPDSTARRILACVYLAILLTSFYALLAAVLGQPQRAVQIALVLFPLQILYKSATVVAVGLPHPVIGVNIAVIALHGVTLASLAPRPAAG